LKVASWHGRIAAIPAPVCACSPALELTIRQPEFRAHQPALQVERHRPLAGTESASLDGNSCATVAAAANPHAEEFREALGRPHADARAVQRCASWPAPIPSSTAEKLLTTGNPDVGATTRSRPPRPHRRLRRADPGGARRLERGLADSNARACVGAARADSPQGAVVREAGASSSTSPPTITRPREHPASSPRPGKPSTDSGSGPRLASRVGHSRLHGEAEAAFARFTGPAARAPLPEGLRGQPRHPGRARGSPRGVLRDRLNTRASRRGTPVAARSTANPHGPRPTRACSGIGGPPSPRRRPTVFRHGRRRRPLRGLARAGRAATTPGSCRRRARIGVLGGGRGSSRISG